MVLDGVQNVMALKHMKPNIIISNGTGLMKNGIVISVFKSYSAGQNTDDYKDYINRKKT